MAKPFNSPLLLFYHFMHGKCYLCCIPLPCKPCLYFCFSSMPNGALWWTIFNNKSYKTQPHIISIKILQSSHFFWLKCDWECISASNLLYVVDGNIHVINVDIAPMTKGFGFSSQCLSYASKIKICSTNPLIWISNCKCLLNK